MRVTIGRPMSLLQRLGNFLRATPPTVLCAHCRLPEWHSLSHRQRAREHDNAPGGGEFEACIRGSRRLLGVSAALGIYESPQDADYCIRTVETIE